jgi:DNA polymerase III gamma/tau subunit
MIVELAKHIETLLLENDCVIVPDFGGFIVHNVSARKDETELTFLPPYRALGFNPQLNLNDGLLIQSYMSAYDVNYPQAQLLVEQAVNALKDQLAQDTYVELQGVGRLSYNIEDQFVFSPCEAGLCSPALYGFTPFRMNLLPVEPAISIQPTATTVETPEEQQRKRNTLVLHINRRWLNNAVAVVIALVTFYLLSAPVDNTYIEPENYASVGNMELFSQIESQSVLSSVRPMQTTARKAVAPASAAAKTSASAATKAVSADAKATPAKAKENTNASLRESATPVVASNANASTSAAASASANASANAPAAASANISASASTATPTAATTVAPTNVSTPVSERSAKAATSEHSAKASVSTPTVAASAAASKASASAASKAEAPAATPAVKQTRYHIIVASVTNDTEAQQAIQYFASKGYPGATAVKTDGRVRIAIASFADRNEADAKWNEVRKLELFQNAWICSSRN